MGILADNSKMYGLCKVCDANSNIKVVQWEMDY